MRIVIVKFSGCGMFLQPPFGSPKSFCEVAPLSQFNRQQRNTQIEQKWLPSGFISNMVLHYSRSNSPSSKHFRKTLSKKRFFLSKFLKVFFFMECFSDEFVLCSALLPWASPRAIPAVMWTTISPFPAEDRVVAVEIEAIITNASPVFGSVFSGFNCLSFIVCFIRFHLSYRNLSFETVKNYLESIYVVTFPHSSFTWRGATGADGYSLEVFWHF